jgi:hypothetical protein
MGCEAPPPCCPVLCCAALPAALGARARRLRRWARCHAGLTQCHQTTPAVRRRWHWPLACPSHCSRAGPPAGGSSVTARIAGCCLGGAGCELGQRAAWWWGGACQGGGASRGGAGRGRPERNPLPSRAVSSGQPAPDCSRCALARAPLVALRALCCACWVRMMGNGGPRCVLLLGPWPWVDRWVGGGQWPLGHPRRGVGRGGRAGSQPAHGASGPGLGLGLGRCHMWAVTWPPPPREVQGPT